MCSALSLSLSLSLYVHAPFFPANGSLQLAVNKIRQRSEAALR